MKRFFALVLLAVVFFSCKAAKRTTSNEPQSDEANEKIVYHLDSIAAKLDIEPAEGYKLFLQNIQVYIVTKKQPTVGFSIKPAGGAETSYILPQYSNDESYSFGGGVNYQLNPGDKAKISVSQGYPDIKPLASRIIINGYQQKIKKTK